MKNLSQLLHYSKLEVKLHTNIAANSSSCYTLWVFGRALDTKGSGKFTFNPKSFCSILKISMGTLYRWIRDGLGLFFLKVYRRKKKGTDEKIWTVYYKSTFNVAADLHLTDFGVVSFTTFGSLNNALQTRGAVHGVNKFHSAQKSIATEMVAASAQLRARFSVKRSLTAAKIRKRLLAPIDKLFPNNSISSFMDNRASHLQGIMRHGAGLYVNNDETAVYGVSQSTIADILKVTRRTINRRLSLTDKVRLYLTGNEIKEAYYQALQYDAENYTKLAAPYFTKNGQVYRSYVCLYDPDYQFASQKYQRERYAQFIKKFDWANESEYDDKSRGYISPAKYDFSKVDFTGDNNLFGMHLDDSEPRASRVVKFVSDVPVSTPIKATNTTKFSSVSNDNLRSTFTSEAKIFEMKEQNLSLISILIKNFKNQFISPITLKSPVGTQFNPLYISKSKQVDLKLKETL